MEFKNEIGYDSHKEVEVLPIIPDPQTLRLQNQIYQMKI